MTSTMAIALWTALQAAPPELSGEEREAAAALTRELRGTVIYARAKRIKKAALGDARAIDLGEGECARFSPDGKRIAVFHDRRVFVMDADGKNRRQIFDGADWPEDGCAIEFHANGKEIVYVKKGDGLWTVRIADGKTARLDLPGKYNGEISMSADGKKMTARWGRDLYAIDLAKKTHRKFARGCSPGVSPDGSWVINNTGDHHEMVVRRWDQEDGFKISGRAARPDGSWDDFHWSNHPDFIIAAGDRKREESYLLRLSDKRIFRATFEGKTRFPDLWVAKATGGTLAIRTPEPAAREEGRKRDDESRKRDDESRKRRDRRAAEAAPAEETAAAPPAPPPARPWPVSEERLIFVWEDARKPNEIKDASGRLQTCRAEPRGGALFSASHAMDLSGGGFSPEGADDRLLEAARRHGQITVEAVVTPRPRDERRPRGKIVSFGRNLVLRQEHQDLRLSLLTADGAAPQGQARGRAPVGPREIVLASISDGAPTHVIVSYRPGLLVLYLKGVEIFRSESLRGDLSAFAPANLLFGAGPDERGAWQGTLEAIAVYARFLEPAEAAEKARALAARLEPRPATARLEVRARLARTTVVPDPKSIEPYRRALVVGLYEVASPPAGVPARIQIARWGILDGRVVPALARARAGEERTLVLEPFDANPQLESERVLSELDELGLAAPLYFDATPIDAADGRGGRGGVGPHARLAARK